MGLQFWKWNLNTSLHSSLKTHCPVPNLSTTTQEKVFINHIIEGKQNKQDENFMSRANWGIYEQKAKQNVHNKTS